MPLIKIKDVAPDAKLGIWRIDESLEDLLNGLNGDASLDALQGEIAGISSPQRRLEITAVRSTISRLLGNGVTLSHNADGKPYLCNGMNISISHTKGYAAVIISGGKRVSIDIERIDRNVKRVAAKFIRADERASTQLDMLLHWCAKETIYKLYSEDHLALHDMRVSAISGDGHAGIIHTENARHGETSGVFYRIFDGMVLTFAVL